MQLTESLVDRFLDTPPPVGPESVHHRARWQRQLAAPERRARHFVALNGDDIVAIAALAGSGPRLAIHPLSARDGVDPVRVGELVAEAVARARHEGARELHLRLLVGLASEPVWAVVRRTGGLEGTLTDGVQRMAAVGDLDDDGARIGGRVEFRGPVASLPTDDASPLVWRPVHDRALVADLYGRTSVGSGDGLLPGEDAREEVDGWFASSWFPGPDAGLHVGALDGRDVALICAHVDPETGWSSLVFLGLVPEARGRGLGSASHRHGLAMLRAAGGVTYHDGTGADNAAMLATFARHGVPELRRFEVVRWALG